MKKLIAICALLMLFASSTSYAQKIIPWGRLIGGRVIIDQDGEVAVLCVCVPDLNEPCLTQHNLASLTTESSLNSSSSSLLSSSPSTSSPSLSNINLSEFTTTIISSTNNQRVYILKKKKVK